MDCKEALPLIHEHLDGDLNSSDTIKLHLHLCACMKCNQLYNDLERTDIFMRSLHAKPLHVNLQGRIMNALPSNVKQRYWIGWIRNHPAVSVFILFVLIMCSSFISMWNQDQEFMVKTDELEKIVIEGHTVNIPLDKVIEGNIIVEHGNINVEGEVHGDIVVIDGKIMLASTAQISGEIMEIDEITQWVFYKIHEYFKGLFK
jgi:anti-sigma factor RsiW